LSVAHGRCAHHALLERRAFDRRRGTASERGYDARWRRLKARLLPPGTPCAACGRPAQDLHHEPRYVPGTDHENYRLTPLCHPCHSTVTSSQVR
jgi:5-methylcytosine-specific restriction protein A